MAANNFSEHVRELGQKRQQELRNYQQNYKMMQNSEQASRLFQPQFQYVHGSPIYVPPHVYQHYINTVTRNNNLFNNIAVTINFFIQMQPEEAEACNFVKKETLAQVFSRELCKIFKNTFFYRTPLVAALVHYNLYHSQDILTLHYLHEL